MYIINIELHINHKHTKCNTKYPIYIYELPHVYNLPSNSCPEKLLGRLGSSSAHRQNRTYGSICPGWIFPQYLSLFAKSWKPVAPSI